MTAKQRKRAGKKERRDDARACRAVAHVRPDWEYTLLLELRCDECGLEQTRWFGGCVVCGHEYFSFVRFLEPDPRDVPRMERAHGALIIEAWRW